MNSTSLGWLPNYTNTELSTWMKNDLFNALPSDLQSSIKEVNKLHFEFTSRDVGSFITNNEKCFLLTDDEVGAQLYSVAGEGTVYSVFTDNASRKRTKVNGEETWWWLKSGYQGNINRFRCVKADGSVSNGNYESTAKAGVCFGFSI